MPTKLKTKGFRKKLTRQEKLRRQMMRELAERNGQAFVAEALARTPIAPQSTSAIWGENGNVEHLSVPVRTPNWGYSVSGWKKAAQRTRIAFNAPHMGGVSEGRASIRVMKGTTLLRTTLENGTSHITTIEEGGTLPPLPPINEEHQIQAANMLSGGMRMANREAKVSMHKVGRKMREQWRPRG